MYFGKGAREEGDEGFSICIETTQNESSHAKQPTQRSVTLIYIVVWCCVWPQLKLASPVGPILAHKRSSSGHLHFVPQLPKHFPSQKAPCPLPAPSSFKQLSPLAIYIKKNPLFSLLDTIPLALNCFSWSEKSGAGVCVQQQGAPTPTAPVGVWRAIKESLSRCCVCDCPGGRADSALKVWICQMD